MNFFKHKKETRRKISFWLVLAMVVSLLPVSPIIKAEENTATIKKATVKLTGNAETIASRWSFELSEKEVLIKQDTNNPSSGSAIVRLTVINDTYKLMIEDNAVATVATNSSISTTTEIRITNDGNGNGEIKVENLDYNDCIITISDIIGVSAQPKNSQTPTATPTISPSISPSGNPSRNPSASPSVSPSATPTATPQPTQPPVEKGSTTIEDSSVADELGVSVGADGVVSDDILGINSDAAKNEIQNMALYMLYNRPEEIKPVGNRTLNEIITDLRNNRAKTTAKMNLKSEKITEDEKNMFKNMSANDGKDGFSPSDISDILSDSDKHYALDISLQYLIKNMNDEVIASGGSITELSRPVTVVLPIPKTLRSSDYIREYFVLRLHKVSEGRTWIDIIPCDSNTNGTISFKSNLFSKYIFFYWTVKSLLN